MRGPGSRRGSLRRALWSLGRVALVAVSLVGVAVVASFAFLAFPQGREWASRRASELISGTLAGRVEISPPGELRVDRIAGFDVTVWEPEGRRVIHLEGVRVKWRPTRLVRSLLTSGALHLDVTSVHAERLEVDLTREGEPPSLLLGRAFSPAREKPEEPGDGEESLLLRVGEVVVATAVVHHAIDGEGRPIELSDVAATVDVAEAVQGAIEVGRARVPVPGLREAFVGKLQLELAELGAEAGPIALAEVRGALGRSRSRVKLALNGEQWLADVSASVPKEGWSSLSVPFGLAESLSVEAVAKGNFEQAQSRVETRIGGDRLDLELAADFGGPRFAVRATSEGLDLSQLRPAWPKASVPFTLDARVIDLEPLRLSAELQLHPFEYAAQTVPALRWSATIDEERWSSKLQTSTSASELTARLELVRRRGAELGIDGSVRLAEPHRFYRSWLRALDVGELGGLAWSVSGVYRPRARLVRLNTQLHVRDLAIEQPLVSVQSAEVSGEVTSRRGRWEGRLSSAGQKLQSGALRVAAWNVKVGGQLPRLQLQGRANGVLEGEQFLVMLRGRTIDVQPPRLSAGRFYLYRGGRALLADVDSVQLGTAMVVRGLRLLGPGKVVGDLEWSSRRQVADMQAYELDLEQLSSLLSPWLPVWRGSINLSLELDSTTPLRGRIRANAQNLSVPQLQLGEAALDLTAHGGRASGKAWVRLEEDSWASIDLDELSLSELTALNTGQLPTSGSSRLTFNLDLAELSSRIPQLYQSWALKGRVSGHVQSDFGEQGGVSVNAALIGAQALPLKPAARDRGRPMSQVTSPAMGLDLSRTTWVLDADYQLRSGTLSGRLQVDHGARTEPLATAHLTTEVPTQLLVAGKLDGLEELPLQATVELRETAVEELPPGLVPAAFAARLEAVAEIDGTWGDPEASLRATVHDWSSGGQRRSEPVSLRLQANYADSRASGELSVLHQQREVGHTRVELDAPDFLALARPSRFEVQTQVDALPLGCFPFLRDYGVTGEVSARATLLGGTEADATLARRMQLEFSGKDVTMLDVRFERFDGRLQFDEHRLAGVVELEQEQQGHLNATLRASAPRGAGLRELRPDRVSISAEQFEVSPLLLLLNDQLSELRGHLNGSLLAEFGDAGVEGKGRLLFDRGAVQIPQLGERFSDVHVDIAADEGGMLRFNEIRARSLSGRLQGEGWLQYDRLGVREVEARLRIPSDDPFPVVYQGVRFGWLDGTLALTGRRRDEQLELLLHAPDLDVRLEQGDFSVQSLEPSELVKVGAFDPKGRFMELSEGAAEPEPKAEKSGPSIEIRLGDDVWIYQGQGTFTSIDGAVTLLPGGTLEGELSLDEGRIDVMGRVFEVRYGTITFSGNDPPDPTVMAQAVWPSPSGHEIIAEFRGPVSSGTLELRSEPPLTYSQILSALLFGDPEGDLGSGEGGGSAAGAVASTVASAGLGRALSDLSNLDIQASVDVSDSAAPRPEVRVRLSPRVSVQVSYNPVSNPLSEVPDSALLSVDWRLSPRWSLETTFGNHGTSMFDAIWRFRY